MKKRLFCLLLAYIVLLALFPAVFAVEDANDSNSYDDLEKLIQEAVERASTIHQASATKQTESSTTLRQALAAYYGIDAGNVDGANETIQQQLDSMTEEQKKSTDGTDFAMLYAEAVTAEAAAIRVPGKDVVIDMESLLKLAEIADDVHYVTVVSAASVLSSGTLSDGKISAMAETTNNSRISSSDHILRIMLGEWLGLPGFQTLRRSSKTVAFKTNETDIIIRINPDILNINLDILSMTRIDKIRVETPAYALTFWAKDLADDLKEPDSAELTILARVTGETEDGCAIVELEVPGSRLTNPVTISIPGIDGDTFYQTIASVQGPENYRATPQNGASVDYRLDSDVVHMMNSNYRAIPSNYNPVKQTMEGRVAESGKYTVANNQKDFSDIAEKSTEMQNAIRYLASKGIINGTTTTTFSPDNVITRAQIVALLMRGLGKVDNSLKANFTDVPANAWYYHEAASSQKHQIILGYEDGTFRGQRTINKAQITAVAGRILVSEMNYSIPDEEEQAPYLSKYSDQIAPWAQSMVALATRENLVVFRKDGTFSGGLDMTRGDAAILLYRLFKRIWY